MKFSQKHEQLPQGDAGCYEKMLSNPEIRILLARLYSAWDLRNATQDFLREITQDIIDAHSSR